MDSNAQVYRTEDTFEAALERRPAPSSERYANMSIQDKGKRYNTDLIEAIELGFLLDLAEVTVVSALERKESAAVTLARTTRPRRRQVHASHHGLPAE